jgi:hypothetical protein
MSSRIVKCGDVRVRTQYTADFDCSRLYFSLANRHLRLRRDKNEGSIPFTRSKYVSDCSLSSANIFASLNLTFVDSRCSTAELSFSLSDENGRIIPDLLRVRAQEVNPGTTINVLTGIKTLLGFGTKFANSVTAQPEGLLLHENVVYSLFPPHHFRCEVLSWRQKVEPYV